MQFNSGFHCYIKFINFFASNLMLFFNIYFIQFKFVHCRDAHHVTNHNDNKMFAWKLSSNHSALFNAIKDILILVRIDASKTISNVYSNWRCRFNFEKNFLFRLIA